MGQIVSKLKKQKNVEDDEDPHEREFRKYQKQKGYLQPVSMNYIKVNGKSIKSVNHPILKAIYENNQGNFEKEMRIVKSKWDQKEYEWEVCLAFWLAVHLKRLEMVTYLVDNNLEVKKQVYIAFNLKPAVEENSDDGSQVDHDKGTQFFH